MTWAEVDLDSDIWTLGRDRMKAGSAHVVPLAPEALEILKSFPRWAGPYVFSTADGRKPISNFSGTKDRIDALLPGMAPWRFHDLRRTFRTGLSALRVPDTVAELCIGHTQKGLHKIYNLHSYLDEKRHALTAWESHVLAITEPRPDNVVRKWHDDGTGFRGASLASRASFREAGKQIKADAADRLARQIQIAVNRYWNAEKERSGLFDPGRCAAPPHISNDLSSAEWGQRKVDAFMAAASNLLADAEKLEEYFGDYFWECTGGGGVKLCEVQDILGSIGAFPRPLKKVAIDYGRPKERWPDLGRVIAREIILTLRAGGFKRGISAKSETSATASVATDVTLFAIGKEITAKTFAQAM